MLRLRIKIDTWTKGLDEGFREKVRVDLLHLYWELPPQRLWIFLKRWRFMINGGTILGLRSDVHDYALPEELIPGPEDVVAKSKHPTNVLITSNSLLTFEIVREIFLPSSLSRMMYFAAGNHLKLDNPEFGVVRELNFDEEGARRLVEERSLVFGPQGMLRTLKRSRFPLLNYLF
jgi:hypothetical protein